MVVARGGMREVAIWRESNLKKDSFSKLQQETSQTQFVQSIRIINKIAYMIPI